MVKLILMAHAEAVVSGSSKTGQNIIRRNMTNAGASQEQIDNALRNAARGGTQVTRVPRR